MGVEVAAFMWADRHMPVSLVGEQAKLLVGSGAVDGVHLPDHLVNFIPPQLWIPEVTPMASVLKDPDSMSDAFAIAAYLLALIPSMNISLGTDTVRRTPAELMQTMLTIANMAGGEAIFQFGAGEQKQAKPYGHKRSQGLSKMADLFAILRLFLENKGEPFDFAGDQYTFSNATIGAAMPKTPAFFGLGAGPRLLDATTTYADGLGIACPPAAATAELFGEARAETIGLLERKGRDPSTFRFAVWLPVLLTDGGDMTEELLDNALIRWIAAVFGRIDTGDWVRDGLANPMPDGWSYFTDLVPHEVSSSFIDETLAKVTRKHVERSYLVGTPDEVADQIYAYVQAGADWISPMDYAPMARDPGDGEAAFARQLALYHEIKRRAK